MPIDFKGLKASVNIVDVIGRRIALKKRGEEHYGICPFHDDSHASLQVNQRKQLFKCFACGTGGDVFDFLNAYGLSIKEAAEEIGGLNYTDGQAQQRAVKAPVRVQWKQVHPGDSFPEPDINHYRHGSPSTVWHYHDEEGFLLGFVCRFDTPDGKEVLPLTYCTDGKRLEWRWQGFEIPRPLYNLHLLKQFPEKTVIIVEGEKCADAVNAKMETAIGMAWPGGASSIKHVDWTPLYGRKVILWPDNDEPGKASMLALASMIAPECQLVKWLNVPSELPHKWDVADNEWQPGELRKFVLANITDLPTQQAEEQPEQEFEQHDIQDEPEIPTHSGDDYSPIENPFFKFCGYVNEGGRAAHCFFPVASKIIVKFNNSQLSKAALIDLAPLNFWEMHFPKRNGGIDVDAATNWLANTSMAIGIFSPKLIRGRGAWHDEGRTVVHAGTNLIVNGNNTPLGMLRTKFVYEVGEPLGFSQAPPLENPDAVKLISILKMLNWERDINAYLLAGWCVVAPICGALTWRPHIWLTGAAGTGKTWVFTQIVRRLLGETALSVQGETSEAGIRQSLQHDALPVVFDEAEGEDKRAQDRIQTILNLMRSASAEDGGMMVKGSSSGTAITYRIRSCFAFASIGINLSQQSDRTRVTLLALKNLSDKRLKDERWKQLVAMYAETFTEEYVARLQSRTLNMVQTILKNAQVFANAAASVLGEQRMGDQLGALLAGAYSLHSKSVISYEEAVNWVSDKDWSEERGLEATKDENRLFEYIMQQIIRVETGAGVHERQLSELILISVNALQDPIILQELAASKIRRLGVKADMEFIIISNSANGVKNMLKNTAWERNHARILLRLEGAKEYPSTKFAPGMQTRAVGVPLKFIL